MPARQLYPIPRVKLHIPRKKAKLKLPAPKKPTIERTEPELFAGQINGIKASMPEERLGRELQKRAIPFEFRRTIGAPRGLPGWKELDFLVSSKGQIWAIEVDTAFTHRDKGRADVLHDTIVIQELNKEGVNVFPQVIHLDGESDLVDAQWTKRTVDRLFI